MSESELRSEDSLQPVKYLGKTRSSHAHGIGIANVSYTLYSFSIHSIFSIQGTCAYCMETFKKRCTL
jgi:hypothetical protein